jgi:hypothetical protein
MRSKGLEIEKIKGVGDQSDTGEGDQRKQSVEDQRNQLVKDQGDLGGRRSNKSRERSRRSKRAIGRRPNRS